MWSRRGCRRLVELPDHFSTECRQCLRCGEVAEPHVDPFDPAPMERAEVVDELGRGTDDRSLPETPPRRRFDLIAWPGGRNESDLRLERTACVSCERPHLVELVEDVGVHVPPV